MSGGLYDRVLAFVEANPGCTSRDVSAALFGADVRVRSGERTRACSALRELVEAGKLKRANREKTDASAVCYAYWIAPVECVPEAVMLDRKQRHLIKHALRWGLKGGYIGQPGRDLLAHLEAEEARLG